MTETARTEDLWGYAKRLAFVDGSIRSAFHERQTGEIRVLDVGCGNGSQLTAPLADLGYQVTGIDTHEPSIRAALATVTSKNLQFHCASVEELEASDFDVVILSEVLEHVEAPEKLLRSSVTKLSADGLAIVTVPNGYGEFEWDSWVYRGLGGEWLVDRYVRRRGGSRQRNEVEASTENLADRHINFFTLSRIREIFDSEGLAIVRKRPATLFAGPIVGHTLARSRAFIEWNARVSDRLPLSFASGWYFALRKKREKQA